jgi:hypothetical protein
MQCRLFGHVDRPAVCGSLAPELAMCGTHRQQALSTLTLFEEGQPCRGFPLLLAAACAWRGARRAGVCWSSTA